MAGEIYKIINLIVEQKSNGNELIASSIYTKLILKGINVDKYDATSSDDPLVIEKLRTAAQEFGVKI